MLFALWSEKIGVLFLLKVNLVLNNVIFLAIPKIIHIFANRNQGNIPKIKKKQIN